MLLIDDILEFGRTPSLCQKDLFSSRGARRVLIAVALEKPHKREMDVAADFVGFSMPGPVRDRLWHGFRGEIIENYRSLARWTRL